MTQRLEIAHAAHNDLGEVPVWCGTTKRLIWTDIRTCRLLALDPATGNVETWNTPDWIGALALAGPDRLLLASRKSVLDFDMGKCAFRVANVFEPGMPTNRANDGRCDRQGRFWFGTLNNAERIPTGSLYCYDGETSQLDRKLGDIIVPNALSWSPDSRTMYFADSWVGDIWAFDFDPDDGAITNRRVLLSRDALPGIPDGATVDADGCLWHTRYGAGQVARVTPDGRVDRVIQSETMQLTAVALGGSDLRDLYVTSARQRMSEAELAAQPDAGALFVTRVDVPGLAEPVARIGTG